LRAQNGSRFIWRNVRCAFIGALPMRAINLLKPAPARQLIAARDRKIR
jgi:hypothetical protein